MFIHFYPTPFYISLTLLILTLIVLRLQGNNPYHIIFSAIFGIYLIGAISMAVFPFSISDLNTEFHINLNLILFNFGNCFDYMPQNCVKDIFNNILLTVPFGFGIHFITLIKSKNVFWLTIAIGCFFELTQLIIAIVFRAGFRSVDINDLLLNTMGAYIGYILFKGFSQVYLLGIQKLNLQPKHIFAYIHEIVTIKS
jgi:glycopeptide antibiotics resistance protein